MDGLFIYALFPVLRKYVNDCLFGLFSVNSYNIFQFGCLHFISAGDLLGREEWDRLPNAPEVEVPETNTSHRDVEELVTPAVCLLSEESFDISRKKTCKQL